MGRKLVGSIREALELCGLRDGMCVSFNHHLRNGDMVMPMVLHTIAEMGCRDIKLFASSVMDGVTKAGLTELVEQEVITEVDTDGADRMMGRLISDGKLKKVCKFRTHGGRPRAIMDGSVKIDIAFVTASAADDAGNCNGSQGPNAFGALGYSMTDTKFADKVVVVTDTLYPYPLQKVSVDESYVDYVVKVDRIGDTAGVATGIIKTQVKDPVALALAKYAAAVIGASGLLKDGFAMQSGASGPAIATARYVKEIMRQRNVHGSYLLGGATAISVDLVKEGFFDTILDVQSFDLEAIRSIGENPWHREISDSAYANSLCCSNAVDGLDTVILGALEVDTDFNANVCVNSLGYLSGGSGGHGDTAAGAKLAILVLPTNRGRFPGVVKKVQSVTTPGENIDVVVTQYGVAVHPKHRELEQRLRDARLPVKTIHELQELTEKITGIPQKIRYGDKLVAEIYHRDGYVIDRVYNRIPE